MQLEGLAQAGVRFSDVTVSGTWTWPGHAELFTGLPPWENGAHNKWSTDLDESTLHTLSTEVPTLAEQLSAAGYRSLAYASNGWLSSDLGLTRGFEQVHVNHGQDGMTINGAIEAMGTDSEQPLFLFVNLLQAHSPFMAVETVPWSAQHIETLRNAPPWLEPIVDTQPAGQGVDLSSNIGDKKLEVLASEGQHNLPPEGLALISDLYDGGLVSLDNALQSLVAAWIASGRSREVMVVTSDHGELLGEHGLLQHGGSCYPELLSVPLVIAAPGRIPANQTISTPVQIRDIAPTLLDLTGVKPGSEGSLLPIIQGASRPGPITARAWVFHRASSGPLSTGWRYYREHPMAVLVPDEGAPQLYDVSTDPMMTVDLATKQPELTTRLAAAARTHIVDGPETDPVDGMAQDLRANLEALGYLD
jgi:arylsulfatase A-like enzyme